MTQDTSSREEYNTTYDTIKTCRCMRVGIKFHTYLSTNLIDKLLPHHLPRLNSILLRLPFKDIFIRYKLDRNMWEL